MHRHEQQSMNWDRFERIVLAYGSKPSLWPAGERQAAMEFLAASQRAQDLVAQQRALDDELDQVESVQPSRSLRDRILRAVGKPSWSERLDGWASSLWPIGHNWSPIGALAAAAALGIAIGWLSPATDSESTAEVADIGLDDGSDWGELP